MNWIIIFTMSIAEPFAVERLKFDSENECLKYLKDPGNASTLAIEVIDITGFNDTILNVQCIPDYKLEKEEHSV